MVAPRQVVIVIPIAAALGREKKKTPSEVAVRCCDDQRNQLVESVYPADS